MIGGTFGRIIHVNLTSGNIDIEYLNDDILHLLVGGRALIAYLLIRDLSPKTDPLSSNNLLIFAPGILQGSGLLGTGRHAVGGKSPLTNCIGSSEAGGWWGDEFKRTGFDALVVHGSAKAPVYLWIKDDFVEIRPAKHLWGLDTAQTQSSIRTELGDGKIRIAQIGPAGENKVLYAAVMHDINRAAGRNGLGALMGSKNLKAVAVRGTTQPQIVDKSRLKIVSQWIGENYKTAMAWAREGVGLGTLDNMRIGDLLGGLPTQNFDLPEFQSAEQIFGERFHEEFLIGRDTCQSCPVHCKQIFKNIATIESQNINPVFGGAEYEGIASFGSNCGIADRIAILKANERCNAYGLDTISTGAVIAFAMECFQKGILDSQKTEGLELHWGNSDAMLKAVELIAHRQGFGDFMADGVARMSARLGSATESFNLTVKSQELPMHEGRLKQGTGLGYALSPIGADHIVNIHDTYYASKGIHGLDRVNASIKEPIQPITLNGLYENKLRIMYYEINWFHFLDCAVICHFYPYNYQHLAEALSGVTGIEYCVQDVLDVGKRAQTLSRIFNSKEGFTEADDKLPKRLMEAFKEGPIVGKAIDPKEFEWGKRRYYELMGWNCESGMPTARCIQDLSLDRISLKLDS